MVHPRTCGRAFLVLLSSSSVSGWTPPPSPHRRTALSRRPLSAPPSSPDVASTADALPREESSGGGADAPIAHQSSVFGRVRRILLPGESSSLGAAAVPTYAASGPSDAASALAAPARPARRRGLEGVLDQAPSFVLDDVLSADTCETIIGDCEALGFGTFDSGKNRHGAMQLLVAAATADAVAQRLCRHVDVAEVEALRREMRRGSGEGEDEEDVRLVCGGLNRRWRIYRYGPGGEESFAPHVDAGFPPAGLSGDGGALVWDASDRDGAEVVSRLTVLLYLNDDFVGGATNFFGAADAAAGGEDGGPALLAAVRPRAGSCLVFPQGVGEEAVEYARRHWPTHEGSPVRSGRSKYVVRSDVLFVTHTEPLLLHDPLFRNDHLVRRSFLPTSPALDERFLGHAASLYNPHMGVENLGPFLYSFIKFTKKRSIVEIGAGYTTLWILQALAENDAELARIRELQRTGRCRLLDIDWTIGEIVEDYDREPARLFCIDNCEHQKETATGAGTVANSLGLAPYLHFQKGDAFDLTLAPHSVDVLWCDFGVGTRMAEFVAGAWHCLRPGGFLLCHSTLTNENTRAWLEACRRGEGEEATGMPAGEYAEVSLLEPQKRYQNAVSVLQKRGPAAVGGGKYEEPIYSVYS